MRGGEKQEKKNVQTSPRTTVALKLTSFPCLHLFRIGVKASPSSSPPISTYSSDFSELDFQPQLCPIENTSGALENLVWEVPVALAQLTMK
jgi:hypothetical protein